MFQKKIVELLNKELKKVLRQLYDPFIMTILEHEKNTFSVDDWIEAFSHVDSTAGRVVRNSDLCSSWNDNYHHQTSWTSNQRDNFSQNQGNNSNQGNEDTSDGNSEKVKQVRSTLEELLKMESKDLFPHCGWL